MKMPFQGDPKEMGYDEWELARAEYYRNLEAELAKERARADAAEAQRDSAREQYTLMVKTAGNIQAELNAAREMVARFEGMFNIANARVKENFALYETEKARADAADHKAGIYAHDLTQVEKERDAAREDADQMKHFMETVKCPLDGVDDVPGSTCPKCGVTKSIDANTRFWHGTMWDVYEKEQKEKG